MIKETVNVDPTLDVDFIINVPDEVPISVLDTPFQHLANIISDVSEKPYQSS